MELLLSIFGNLARDPLCSLILQWQLSKALFHILHLCWQWQSILNS